MQIAQTIDDVIDDSLKSAERSVAILHQTEDIGVETIEVLDKQGNQINRIVGGLDDIQEKQYEAKQRIRSINSIFGYFFNWIVPKTKKYDDSKKINKIIEKNNKKENKIKYNKKSNIPNNNTTTASLIDYSMVSKESKDKIEKTDKLIDDMLHGVENLKDIAIHQGTLLTQQNEILNIAKDNTDKANLKMRVMNNDIGRHL
jgi:hypothetical protein